MFRHLRFTYSLALAAMALAVIAGEALAQTPEGTVITNTATATYTDANNNPYAAVSGSVSVTVGFKAGVPNGHHLLNRTQRDGVFLVVGSRAAAELGLVYTPLEETFRRTIEWARAEGLVTFGDEARLVR